MDIVPVELTHDPLLRRSLRNLYPELPSWAQRWMIATPGRPLPLPPGYHHPAWHSFDKAEKALDATHAVFNTGRPSRRRLLDSYEDSHTVTRYLRTPRGMGPITIPPNTDCLLVGFEAKEGLISSLTFRDQLGDYRLTERNNPTVDWTYQGRNGATIRAVVGSEGTLLERGPTDSEEVVLADGTSHILLLADGHPRPTQQCVIGEFDNQEAEYATHRLIERWGALTSPADQARVLQYWLGHANPLLAQAGFAALALQRATPTTGAAGL